MSGQRGTRAVRIGNCSGFFGDRINAAREMVDGGDIDVLTGDWLAELTMLILYKQRARNVEAGYASTFLTQMEDVLGTCIERGIKVVTNAGGLNPQGCAAKVRQIASRLSLDVNVAHVEGDDLMGHLDGLRDQLTHLDTGAPLTGRPVSANAYLGGWGIVAALDAGADVVVCPRVTDAAVVLGPAAWWWQWDQDDWDALAGAVVAGHVIECGAQATGGNYARFARIPDRTTLPGFPVAEIDRDGSTVITKHPGTGGLVEVGTVTAQLLYEIGPQHYLNPDVTSWFETIRLDQVGADRVRISGTRGSPPPPTLKVCINADGGFRNRVTYILSGSNQQDKAAWITDALFGQLGGRERFDQVDVRFSPAPEDAPTQEASSGRLHVQVRSADERLVGRAFSNAAIELTLSNYPGLFVSAPPAPAQAVGVYWPALVERSATNHTVVLADDTHLAIPEPPTADDEPAVIPAPGAEPAGPRAGERLGEFFAARSGDKGGNANVGIWADDAPGYAWLHANLDAGAIHTLLPETAGREIRRYELPNLHALNFVVVGLLGEGVASSTAFDPQAKGLGEYLLSRRWPG